MAEFTAAATLDVSVDDGQLRQVRREIERGIGDVSVGIDSGGTGGGGGRGNVEDLLREQIDVLEDIRDRAGGGGGGGGGGTTFVGGLGGIASGLGTAAGVAALGVTGAAGGNAVGEELGIENLSQGFTQTPFGIGGLASMGEAIAEDIAGANAPVWVSDIMSWADVTAPGWVDALLSAFGGGGAPPGGGGPGPGPGGRPGGGGGGPTGGLDLGGTSPVGFDPTLPGVGGERDEDIINVGRRGRDFPPANGGQNGGGQTTINVNPRVESATNARQDLERVAREEGEKAAQRILDRVQRGPGARTIDLFD